MKRMLSLMLLMSILLASCASTSNEPKDTTAVSTEPSDTTAGETGESFDPELPDVRFDGQTFTFITKSISAFTDWGETSIYTDAMTGDVLNDAVYKRNLAIEETYGVTIKEVQSDTPASDLSTSILAGDNAYDAGMLALNDTGTLVTNNLLLALGDIPNIDLTMSWWDQNAVSDLSIDHKLYMASGDISTLNNDATWSTMINLKVLEDYNVESPYDLVRNNEWTYDKFYEICQGVSSDLNGDSVYNYNDLIANLTQDENATAMFLASGIHLVEKDANDTPVFDLSKNEKVVDIIEKIRTIMSDKVVSLNYHKYVAEGAHLVTTKMFEENRGLFWITNLQMVIRLREMNTDFGIAPVPKYNKDQENYSNIVWRVGSFLVVPKTTSDLNRTGIILEAMAAKSREILRPAYYEVALSYKYLRDDDSIEMLDIIIANRTYELEQAFSWGVSTAIDKMILNGGEVSSTFTANESLINGNIQKTLDAIEK